MSIWLLVLSLVLVNSIGQTFLKKSTLTSERKKIYLIIGYSFFLLSLGLVQVLLVYVPFYFLALVISLNLVGVLIFSILFLNEKLTLSKCYGTLIVSLGVVIFLQGNALF